MPSTAFESMLAATLNYRSPEIKRQIDTSHPLSAWLTERKAVDPWTEGGEEMETLIETSLNDTAAARDYKTAIDLKEQNPLDVVKIPRRFLNGSIVWYQAQEDANSSSKTRVVNFVRTLIDNGRDSLANAMALQYWKDGTGENWHGLPAIIDHDNTYQGLDRTLAANIFWRANHTDAVHTSFVREGVTYGPFHNAEVLAISGGTDGGVQAIYNACCANGGGDGPDFGITTEALWNKLKSLVKSDVILYNTRLAEIGYPENIQYHNAAIVWDRNCPAGTLDLLNSKWVKLRPYGSSAKGIDQTPPENMYSSGLRAKVVLIEMVGNMSCSRPNRCGALTAKTAS